MSRLQRDDASKSLQKHNVMAHMSSEPDASDEAVKEQGEHLSDDSTESLRSSPPLLETDQTVIEDETKLNNKRSHEEMNEDPQNVFASSATMIGDVASSAVPSRDLDEPPPKPVNPSSAAHSMRPPALPASSMLPPSQKPPTSAQMPRNPNPVPAPPTKPENVQREESSFEDHDEPQDPGDSAVDSPGDPQDPIEEFEWRKLHERYHAKMQELDGQESEVMNEFHQLCQVR